jgi:hypothetical protein
MADFRDRIEQRYGRANHIWVMDRGVPNEDCLAKMRRIGASYLAKPWAYVREGVQVKRLSVDEDIVEDDKACGLPGSRAVYCQWSRFKRQ